MIRNVVMGRLADDADLDAVGAAMTGIETLDPPGCTAMTLGRDLGLRDGGWDLAIVNDWVDAAAYRTYDLEKVHNEHRAVLAANCAEIARVQFEL